MQAQAQADREAVRQAVLDYVEGIYGVDPSRVERSVHPKLAKIGFYRGPNDQEFRSGSNMTFEQLIDVAKNWNKAGKLRKDAPKEVTIYDVLATHRRDGGRWGIDFMHGEVRRQRDDCLGSGKSEKLLLPTRAYPTHDCRLAIADANWSFESKSALDWK